jgi:hypothetical protein
LLADTTFTCWAAALLVLAALAVVAAFAVIAALVAVVALVAAAAWTLTVEGRTAAELADPDTQNAVTTPAVATPATTAGTTMVRRRLERTVDGCWLAKGFLPGQDALTWKIGPAQGAGRTNLRSA